MNTHIKIAIVKSTSYTDLWACKNTDNPYTLFRSSLMRCPPIGLMEYLKSDYLIVKECFCPPCQEISYSFERDTKYNMRFLKEQKNTLLPFLDETYHKDISLEEISQDLNYIDWNKYNIVITINACIPERIIKAFPNVLWCYYVSENCPDRVNNLLANYDLILNQDVTLENLPPFSIGFPYTFLGPKTLEDLNIKYLNNNIKKCGIYIEINNNGERPVRNVQSEFYKISEECNMPLFLHDQNIIENSKNLYESKYFIKLFGRKIRGNSAIEAASSGTLMILNKNLITYSDLIFDKCHVETYQDAITTIKYFEENPEEYIKAVHYQREILRVNYCETPIKNLIDRYNKKLASKTTST